MKYAAKINYTKKEGLQMKRKLNRFLSLFLVTGIFISMINFLPANAVDTATNERIIMEFCRDNLGTNTAATCGILANIYKESSFNPTASCIDTNGLTSYGICQWNGTRFTDLKNFCAKNGYSYSSLEGQLYFLKSELNGSERNAFLSVKNVENTAQGAYNAGYNWAKKFERCSSVYYEQRAVLARDTYWKKYGTIPPVVINNPEGYFDNVQNEKGKIRVRGWAFDKDNISQALNIHVYIGGSADSGVPCYVITADTYRDDVNAVYGCGNYHGFDSVIETNKRGVQEVYIYAINIGNGNNVLLGNKSVNITAPDIQPVDIGTQFFGIIKHCYSSKVATVSDTSSVVLAQTNNLDNQVWYFEKQNDLSYKITALTNGKVLDLQNSDVSNQSKILNATDTDSNNQRWYFIRTGSGYSIITKCNTEKAVDIPGNNTDDGTDFQIYDKNNTDAQIFQIDRKDINLKPIKIEKFGGHTYEYYMYCFNWIQAEKFCERKGGHLVTVNSQTEQNFIEKMTVGIAKGTFATWLGGYDCITEGKWEWNTGEEFVYTNWAGNQPDNANSNEHYLCMYLDGKWNDLTVNPYQFGMSGFICEYENIDESDYHEKQTVQYDGHVYKYYEYSVDWNTAKQICEQKGGHLVTIETSEEQSALHSIIRRTGNIFLGATDIDSEGNWYWLTGKKMTYTNWATSQPDNYKEIEHYLQLWEDGLWNDAEYSSKSCKGFICEFDEVCDITLDKKSLQMTVGDKKTLKAEVFPKEFDAVCNWFSSNSSVATVDKNGTITARSEGKTTITAKINDNLQSSCEVTVKPEIIAIKNITLDKTEAVLDIGKTLTLIAEITPSNATNQSIIWISGNEDVATVSGGLVKAVGEGETRVIAQTSDGKEAVCEITVRKAVIEVENVKLNKTSATLKVSEILQLTATIMPANATDKNIEWFSDNDGIATVVNGKVTAKSEGQTKITAKTNNGKTAECVVKVNPVADVNHPQIVVESLNTASGTFAELNISLKNNPGIVGMTIDIDFDESVLTLTEVKDGGLLGTNSHKPECQSPYTLSWSNDVSTTDYSENGVIATLKFAVSDTASTGEYPITVSYDYDNMDIYNKELEKIKFQTVNGSITVVDYLCGDVNSDGKVNNLDKVILTRYLAKWNDYQNINTYAADVNNDGKVNNLDRVILTRHLAHWNEYSNLPYKTI